MYFLVLNVELLICAISVPVVLASHYEYYTYYTASTRENCYQDSYESCEGWWWGTTCHPNYYTKCNGVVYFVAAQQGRRCQSGWRGTDCNTPICFGCKTGTRCTAPDSCTDIDKCAEGTSGCAHTCTDTANSYICSCYPGYRLADDGRLCDDINECTEGKVACEHNCSNTAGSYSCRCNAGYRMRSDGHTCADINECTEGKVICQHNCSNTAGSYSCRCNAGYRLASDGYTCADIDECVQSPCDMQHKFPCQNTNGGYQCVCESGFKNVGPHECHDIDECENLTNNCTLQDNMTCENTIGSYKCVLRQGVNRNSTIIAVIVCVFVGLFLIIVAAVCFIKRGKTRLRNKQEADATTTNKDLAAEAVYYNVVKTSNSKSNESKTAKERQKTEAIYGGLDLNNLQRENFYEALEKLPKTYAHVCDNATDTST